MKKGGEMLLYSLVQPAESVQWWCSSGIHLQMAYQARNSSLKAIKRNEEMTSGYSATVSENMPISPQLKPFQTNKTSIHGHS